MFFDADPGFEPSQKGKVLHYIFDPLHVLFRSEKRYSPFVFPLKSFAMGFTGLLKKSSKLGVSIKENDNFEDNYRN